MPAVTAETKAFWERRVRSPLTDAQVAEAERNLGTLLDLLAEIHADAARRGQPHA